MTIEIHHALTSLRPGAEFVVSGTEIKSLDADVTVPTDAEIKSEMVKLQPTHDARQEIARLESTVTPRRIREMTTVAGAKWVDDVEKLIAIERSKL
jgi:hypothetical protein